MQKIIDEITRDKSPYGWTQIAIYDKLIRVLGYLAGKWRGTKDDEVTQEYQTVLRTLIIIGYEEELPVDHELPDRLMPQEYLELFSDE